MQTQGLSATKLWIGLLDGKWSIVDRLDQNGRRFLVAQKHVGAAVDQGALTARERQVIARAVTGNSVKEIAFEFGVASSTVTQILRGAFMKMGISCRTELVRIHAAVHRNERGALDHDSAQTRKELEIARRLRNNRSLESQKPCIRTADSRCFVQA
jgi:DNA-binding CsgD family transcriptional regulator